MQLAAIFHTKIYKVESKRQLIAVSYQIAVQRPPESRKANIVNWAFSRICVNRCAWTNLEFSFALHDESETKIL